MNDRVTRSVRQLYEAHAFPQWTREMRRRMLASELCRYRSLGMDQAMSGARLLDVGCGTGNRTILAARALGVSRMVGLALSPTSLAVAVRVASEEDFAAFSPVRASILDAPFDDASTSSCRGGLHHTPEPRKAFREMIRLCRPAGFVAIFLYNKWNHWRHNLQKRRVDRLAGEDVERRFHVAHSRYGRKPLAEMTDEEIAVFYDQYCHPHKSDTRSARR